MPTRYEMTISLLNNQYRKQIEDHRLLAKIADDASLAVTPSPAAVQWKVVAIHHRNVAISIGALVHARQTLHPEPEMGLEGPHAGGGPSAA